MDKDAFIALGQRLYGRVGWQRQLATDLKLTPGTVSRYANGRAVPQIVQLAMRGLEADQTASRAA